MALLLPIRLFEVGNPDWRPLGWLHAAIVVALTFLIIWRTGGPSWVRHFAFPVAFILIAVPWISAVETPIIQGLMRVVAAIATETLGLFGIPAQLEGSVIRINSGVVGVNEACSGVRSLQTSLMIGLLFGELKRLSMPRRIALLGAAVAIAFVANCARGFFLVWIAATRGLSAVDQWHDMAGYAILLAVFAGTMGIAALLSRKGKRPKIEDGDQKSQISKTSDFRPLTASFRIPISVFLVCLLWLVIVEASVEGWYRLHERNLEAETPWTVQWPTAAPGFRLPEIDDGVQRTLRFDTGSEAFWMLADQSASFTSPRRGTSCVGYFFRWNPGGSSVVRARAHRPDICLPDAGWEKLVDLGITEYAAHKNLKLPFRRATFRKQNGRAVAHTFFALQEDRRRPSEARPDLELTDGTQPDWSLAGRAQVVRNGVRNLGQQVLEIVLVSGEDIGAAEADRQFSQLLPQIIIPASQPKSGS